MGKPANFFPDKGELRKERAGRREKEYYVRTGQETRARGSMKKGGNSRPRLHGEKENKKPTRKPALFFPPNTSSEGL